MWLYRPISSSWPDTKVIYSRTVLQQWVNWGQSVVISNAGTHFIRTWFNWNVGMNSECPGYLLTRNHVNEGGGGGGLNKNILNKNVLMLSNPSSKNHNKNPCEVPHEVDLLQNFSRPLKSRHFTDCFNIVYRAWQFDGRIIGDICRLGGAKPLSELMLLIRTIGTNFSEIWIEIRIFSFKKMHLKISSAKWWQYYVGLNVLNWAYHRFTISQWSHWSPATRDSIYIAVISDTTVHTTQQLQW